MKSNTNTETAVARIPMCDSYHLEDVPALYDAKTVTGQWGYLCQSCFDGHGSGLGLGLGQRLVLREDG